MKKIRLTMAQALVRFLNNQYVEFDGKETKFVEGIFTIFGHGNVLGIGEALQEENHSLIVHQGRNEQGMAHAAIGFAKQMRRKKIYACTSSVGPGSANMVTAAGTATANRIPVLFLPGDTFASRQPDPVLQQIEHFHEMSLTTNDAFKPVSKYWDRINRPEQLMSAMINAMRVLTDEANTGAVVISLPQDVQGEAYDYPEYFLEKRVHKIVRRVPNVVEINEAIKLMKTKKKPLLICGGGVKYSNCENEFQEFAEKFNIPFGETQAGKGSIISEHFLNLGGIGVTGNLAANIIAKEADLIIGVGTRYTDFTTASKSLFQNPKVSFININISDFDAYKLDGLKLVGDAREILKELIENIENYTSGYKDEIEKVKLLWKNETERLYKVKYYKNFIPEVSGQLDSVIEEFREKIGTELTQTRVIGILNTILDKEDIIVGASGSLPGDLQRVWKTKANNTYHMEYGYSCMGYEVNAALGVKLAVNESAEVYSMVGDGAYLMLHSELLTAIQENKKINIVLFDNISFGCINNLQMGNGMDSLGTEFRKRNIKTGKLDGELIKIDFAKSAEGYGCKTYSIKTEDELLYALKDAKNYKECILFDIKVLPKTMTNGYDSWWRVGNAQVTNIEKIELAYQNSKESLKKIREY